MSTNEPPVGPGSQDPDPSVPPPPPPPPSYGSTQYPPPGDSSGAGGAGGGYGGAGGGYPPPPPSDPGYAAPFSAPEAIGFGWRRFTGNAGQWLLAGLLIVVVSLVFALLSWMVQPDVDPGDEFNAFSSFSFLSVLVNIASTLVGYVITAFVYRGALDETEGRKFVLGDTFSRVPVGAVIITSLLVAIGVTIGIVLCVLPGLVFAFLSWFALLFVVDKNQSPVDAITSSVKLIWANFGQALLLALLAFVIILIGACLCGLGLFVAYPVTTIASAYAYKRFQNEPVAA